MNAPEAELFGHDLSAVSWRKSSASGAENNCVEVAGLPSGAKAVRDSKDPARTPLRFTASVWAAFRTGVIDGDL
ncbi:DUF397 domain-containing protein [Streptomyces atratus]|uniref:DUF397 domain-containing protein n=1 Tax=Streptomyces atratus TaxID=1893 RepID=UPI002259408F|nr:DUF397 domain-containing protein [Streptomyces atratus]MCX5344428.1 DUF397 domain-containing protein [Streptomyces atratus]